MLSATKSRKMLAAIKDYRKKYLSKDIAELDESGTRIMINAFLTSILGYRELEEVKTEYMIKGTYADYIIQIGGQRHFLVEVKAYSLDLSGKHLGQAINYGANEGIDWAILTNGRHFQLYKILFEKPICEKLVLEIDFLADDFKTRAVQEQLAYLHRDAVLKKSLNHLWSRCTALDPLNIAGLLHSPHVLNFLKRELRKRHKARFSMDEIVETLNEVICGEIPVEQIKLPRLRSKKRRCKNKAQHGTVATKDDVSENPLEFTTLEHQGEMSQDATSQNAQEFLNYFSGAYFSPDAYGVRPKSRMPRTTC